MAAGTYAGGWRIIKTLGTRIAKIDPPQGFAAQTACAAILYDRPLRLPGLDHARHFGLGHGRGRQRGLPRCAGASPGNIMVAWILTIPMAGLVGGLMEVVTNLPGGELIVFILAVLTSVGAFVARRWQTRRRLPAEALESAPI